MPFCKTLCPPLFHRPLGTENEGTFCLAVPAKAMAEVWEFDRQQIKITTEISVESEMEDEDRPLFEPTIHHQPQGAQKA